MDSSDRFTEDIGSSTDKPASVEVARDGSDDEVAVAEVLAGDVASFERIMRRYNQRMFRTVRSILGDDHEAEDVVQEAYVRAYEHLSQFAGRAKFSTWLTKIAVHEALARRRRSARVEIIDLSDPENATMSPHIAGHHAEDEASRKELGPILTSAVDALPDDLRTVFALRMIEELDTEETANCLELSEENVKVRLHRARALLRKRLDHTLGIGVRELYQFDGERCDRIVRAVLTRLASRR